MRIISSCLVAALLGAGTAVPAFAATGQVRIDVGLTPGTDPAAIAAVLGIGPAGPERVHGLDAFTLDVPAERADAALVTLTGTPGVRYAERGALVQADGETPVSGGFDARMREAWTWTKGSADITVAVVDTGVSPTIDLAEDRLTSGYDFVDDDSDPVDDDGHGTVVASIIGADHDNGSGTSGACDACGIMPVRVMSARGGARPAEGTTADAAAGIVWAADHGADIINVSLSTASRSLLLKDAVDHASGRGALVVASAGNVRSTARRYPAAFEPVLAVEGAHDVPHNTGADRWVDLSAHSVAQAIGANGQWDGIRGSSPASALVSGAAALLYAMAPDASAQQIRALLQKHAKPLTGHYNGQDVVYAPAMNAAESVYAAGGVDTAAPVLTSTFIEPGQLIGASGAPVVPKATDDHGIKRIEYIGAGKVLAAVPASGDQSQLVPPAGYNGALPVTVRAYDYAGNTDEEVVTVQVDTRHPTVTFVSPSEWTAVHGRIEFVVSVPEKDSVPIGNGVSSATMTRIAGTNRWKGVMAVTQPVEETVQVAFEDRAENRTTLTRYFRVDNEAPAGGRISPTAGKRVRGTFTSTLTGVTDYSGVVKAQLWANGKYVGTGTSLGVGTGRYSGNLVLTWKVTDKFGQSRTLPARTVIADNKAPSVSITKAPKNKAKVKGTVKVSAKASDASGIARVELLVNGKVVATDKTAGYVLSVNTAKQKKTMKVRVRAYDKLGNVTYTATRDWRR